MEAVPACEGGSTDCRAAENEALYDWSDYPDVPGESCFDICGRGRVCIPGQDVAGQLEEDHELCKNDADDPNEVLFIFTAADLDRARKFIESVHRQARKENAIANLPEMIFLRGG